MNLTKLYKTLIESGVVVQALKRQKQADKSPYEHSEFHDIQGEVERPYLKKQANKT